MHLLAAPVTAPNEALRAIMRSFEFEPLALQAAGRSRTRTAPRRSAANRKSKIQNRK